MRVNKLTNIDIFEIFNDDMNIGDKAYRIISWVDEDILLYEISECEMGFYEGGDAESGPKSYSRLSNWVVVELGMGQIPCKPEDIVEYLEFSLNQK